MQEEKKIQYKTKPKLTTN